VEILEQLDKLLNYLEENIDLEHVKNVEKLHLDVIDYKQVPYLPLSLVYPIEDFTPVPYDVAYEDPEKMMFNELLSTVRGCGVYNSVKLKDHFPMHIRSNYGVGIMPSLFGAQCRLINNNMPWVDHFELDEIKKIISRGVPDYYQALGKRVIDTNEFYKDKLKDYPKCSQAIKITQPDMQGPFDIAHLLMGGDMFYALYDEPEIIHELLELVTQTYIGFKKRVDSTLNESAGDNAIYLHGDIFGGKVLIKDDTASINLSENMYNEFSKQYNEKVLEEFEGGSLHFCGLSRTWHSKCMDSKWLRGINYGNPELQDLKSIYQYWSERKIPNLLWGDVLCLYRQDYDFIDEIHKLNINTGMSLMIRVDSFEEAQNIFKKHTNA
jgi:hypothetical protein